MIESAIALAYVPLYVGGALAIWSLTRDVRVLLAVLKGNDRA